MTNEELVQRHRAGDQAALWQLWQQNQGFTRKQALRVLRARLALGCYDTELEDLLQSAWFALERAAGDYDPGSGCKFLTYYDKRLKTAFAEATGTRSEKQKRDPLHTADSIDRPLDYGDPEGDTLGDLAADPVDQYEEVEERLYHEWLRDFLSAQLDKLPPEQAEPLRLQYWYGMTLNQIAEACGVKRDLVVQRKARGLRQLRRQREVLQLRQYINSRTDFYRGGADPVLSNVLWREALTEQWTNRRGSGEEAARGAVEPRANHENFRFYRP